MNKDDYMFDLCKKYTNAIPQWSIIGTFLFDSEKQVTSIKFGDEEHVLDLLDPLSIGQTIISAFTKSLLNENM